MKRTGLFQRLSSLVKRRRANSITSTGTPGSPSPTSPSRPGSFNSPSGSPKPSARHSRESLTHVGLPVLYRVRMRSAIFSTPVRLFRRDFDHSAPLTEEQEGETTRSELLQLDSTDTTETRLNLLDCQQKEILYCVEDISDRFWVCVKEGFGVWCNHSGSVSGSLRRGIGGGGASRTKELIGLVPKVQGVIVKKSDRNRRNRVKEKRQLTAEEMVLVFVPKNTYEEFLKRRLYSVKCERFSMVIQRWRRQMLSDRNHIKILGRCRQLINLKKEFVENDDIYVKFLEAIDECYREPLKEILTKRELDVLLPGFSQVLALSKEVHLAILRGGLLEGFAEIAPRLRLLSTFVANFSSSMVFWKKLNSYMRTIASTSVAERFDSIVSSAISDPRCHQLNLTNLLAKPFQRVIGYKNILESVVKYSLPASPAHHEYLELLHETRCVCDYVNHARDLQKMLSQLHDLGLHRTYRELEHTSQFGEMKICLLDADRSPLTGARFDVIGYILSDLVLFVETFPEQLIPILKSKGMIMRKCFFDRSTTWISEEKSDRNFVLTSPFREVLVQFRTKELAKFWKDAFEGKKIGGEEVGEEMSEATPEVEVTVVEEPYWKDLNFAQYLINLSQDEGILHSLISFDEEVGSADEEGAELEHEEEEDEGGEWSEEEEGEWSGEEGEEGEWEYSYDSEGEIEGEEGEEGEFDFSYDSEGEAEVGEGKEGEGEAGEVEGDYSAEENEVEEEELVIPTAEADAEAEDDLEEENPISRISRALLKFQANSLLAAQTLESLTDLMDEAHEDSDRSRIYTKGCLQEAKSLPSSISRLDATFVEEHSRIYSYWYASPEEFRDSFDIEPLFQSIDGVMGCLVQDFENFRSASSELLVSRPKLQTRRDYEITPPVDEGSDVVEAEAAPLSTSLSGFTDTTDYIAENPFMIRGDFIDEWMRIRAKKGIFRVNKTFEELSAEMETIDLKKILEGDAGESNLDVDAADADADADADPGAENAASPHAEPVTPVDLDLDFDFDGVGVDDGIAVFGNIDDILDEQDARRRSRRRKLGKKKRNPRNPAGLPPKAPRKRHMRPKRPPKRPTSRPPGRSPRRRSRRRTRRRSRRRRRKGGVDASSGSGSEEVESKSSEFPVSDSSDSDVSGIVDDGLIDSDATSATEPDSDIGSELDLESEPDVDVEDPTADQANAFPALEDTPPEDFSEATPEPTSADLEDLDLEGLDLDEEIAMVDFDQDPDEDPVVNLERTLVQNASGVTRITFLLTHLLLAGCVDGKINFWRLEESGLSEEPSLSLETPGEILCLSPVDFLHFASSSKDHPQVLMWEIGELEPVKVLEGFDEAPHIILWASMESRVIVVSGSDMFCYAGPDEDFALIHKYESQEAAKITNAVCSFGSIFTTSVDKDGITEWSFDSPAPIQKLTYQDESISYIIASRSSKLRVVSDLGKSGRVAAWPSSTSPPMVLDTFMEHPCQRIVELDHSKKSFAVVLDAGETDCLCYAKFENPEGVSYPLSRKVLSLGAFRSLEDEAFFVVDAAGSLHLFDASLVNPKRIRGNRERVTDVMSIFRGKYIVTSDVSGAVRIWQP